MQPKTSAARANERAVSNARPRNTRLHMAVNTNFCCTITMDRVAGNRFMDQKLRRFITPYTATGTIATCHRSERRRASLQSRKTRLTSILNTSLSASTCESHISEMRYDRSSTKAAPCAARPPHTMKATAEPPGRSVSACCSRPGWSTRTEYASWSAPRLAALNLVSDLAIPKRSQLGTAGVTAAARESREEGA